MVKSSTKARLPTPYSKAKDTSKRSHSSQDDASSSSSQQAHHGSAQGSESHHSSSSHVFSSRSSHSREEAVARFMKEERDFKSYAVKEYDAYQAAAKLRHKEALKEVVQRAC